MGAADDGLDDFRVFWEKQGSNPVQTRHLASLPFDIASWIRFLDLCLGRSKVAYMTMHPASKPAVRAKVVREADVTKEMSFDSL